MNKLDLKINELYNKFLFETDENTKIEYSIMLKSLFNYIENKSIIETINEYFEELEYSKLSNIENMKNINNKYKYEQFEKNYLNDSKSYQIIKSLKDLIIELNDSIINNDFVFNRKDFALIYEYIKDDNSKFPNFIRNELNNVFYINDKNSSSKTLVNSFNKDHIYIINDSNKNLNSITLHEITHGYNIINGKEPCKSINMEISPILVQHSFEEYTYTDLNILKSHVNSCIEILNNNDDINKSIYNYKYMIGLLFSIAFNYKYSHNIKTVSKAIDKLMNYNNKSFEVLINDFNINEDNLKNSIKLYTKKIRRD